MKGSRRKLKKSAIKIQNPTGVARASAGNLGVFRVSGLTRTRLHLGRRAAA